MSSGCACHAQLTPEQLTEVDKLLEPYRGRPGNLIQVLHRTQNKVGYLPREVQVRVADSLNVPLAKVYGVVSFIPSLPPGPRANTRSAFVPERPATSGEPTSCLTSCPKT